MTKRKVSPDKNAELRSLAEDRFANGTEQGSHALFAHERLIHELEIHKIELEMQNAELRQTGEDLELLLDKYTELYDFAPVGYFSIDHQGLISNINLAGSGLLGINRARVQERHFQDFIADSDRPAFCAFLERLFKSPCKEKCEVTLRNESGHAVHVEIAAVNAVSGLECRIALMDITERKRAETALEKVLEAADVASQKLEAVAGLARRKVEVVAAVARKKVAEAVELALREEDESVEVATHRLEEAAVAAYRKLEEAAELAHSKVEEAAELAHVKVEEAALLVLPGEREATEAVSKAADLARAMVGKAADMARQKVQETAETMFHALRRAAEAEAQIKFAEERLRHEELLFHSQNLESLGVLAGGIAHDFNNVLTGILGNIALALTMIDETHPACKPLFFAEKAGRRAAELATRLLTFAKGGAPVKKALPIDRVIEESISLARGWADMTCVVRLAKDLHKVEADEAQMSQVFNNIIINAAQAMPGGGTLTIVGENVVLDAGNKLGCFPGSYVRLAFTDDGYGMTDEVQRRIFDPYYTTKSGGTGLGLASAYSIVKKHGGHIAVGSSVGVGTVFTCHLPSARMTVPKPESHHPCPSKVRDSNAMVLVMDDDAQIRNLAVKLLQYLGYGVTGCASGEEAVALYGTAMKAGAPFIAVLMDLTIADGMGGGEAAQAILAIDPAARLIVSSGYSGDCVMADYLAHGFCASLPKPYRVSELARIMNGFK